MSRLYSVAGFNLRLPDDHKLEEYQSVWHLYDRVLGVVAKRIAAKYPQMTAIDIGANVGDSAALIQEFQPVPTLCIEGNPEYLEYLVENAKVVGNIEIADCFIGNEGSSVTLDEIASYGGTTSILGAVDVEGVLTVPMVSLQSLLAKFPQFQNSRLLKIDTDGFDFSIIESSKEFLKHVRPVVYFEYDISFAEDDFRQALSALQLLADLGYSKFSIYDNFGNHIVSLNAKDRQYFFDLTNYLLLNRVKSGQPVVYYFDICAFPEIDLDIFDSVYAEFMLMELSG